MHSLPARDPHAFHPDDMSPAEVAALLGRARALLGAAGAVASPTANRAGPGLRGKYLALLCDVDDADSAVAFREAALALGARVATIRPKLSPASPADEVRHTARVLGRLYDAVECQGMSATLVRAIARDAGIPVYDGLASPDHPIAALAPLLGLGVSSAEQRRLLLQATLLASVG
ncbi:MAG: ornithine carbamoyltransferase [Burkholderiaceae bacterium]